MAEDGFEDEIGRLFDTAPAFGDEDAFVRQVSVRTAKVSRTGDVLTTAAYAVGALVAVVQLAQPSLWLGLADWLNQTGEPLTDTQLWMTPNPLLSAGVIGAMILTVYVAKILREPA